MTTGNTDAGYLTTHILDTARGCPAEDIPIKLYRITSNCDYTLLGNGKTNSDGRLKKPILSGSDFQVGKYEIRFEVRNYLKRHFKIQFDKLFLEEIPIRFNIADQSEHYHVPLLLAPFGYTTYRGS